MWAILILSFLICIPMFGACLFDILKDNTMSKPVPDYMKEAIWCASKLSLRDRVKLCIAILSPDATLPNGKLSRALELLKGV